jgi:amidase
MNEALFRSATDAARTLSRKEIASRELTEMLLARIDAANPPLNAVVELRREEALHDAAAADEAIAGGEDVGPLHGVPMTIKDSFNVAGMHTTWGNPAFKDYVADTDATVVGRLKRAGAIIVGKTNVHFMLGDFGQTANELYGVTNNPWDTTRTPGGSTGGGAAALSAGMTFLEYGSDLVGSIRIPASFCGVYGLRPSVGIVPLTGFQPPGPPADPSDMMHMSAVGPLGRFARDLRTALMVTGGPEGQAAKAYSWTLSPPRHTRLEGFRVGFVLDHEHAPVSSEVVALLSKAVELLAQAGATVVEGWPDGVDPVQHHESFGFHVQLFFAFQQPGGGACQPLGVHRAREPTHGGSCRLDTLLHGGRRLPVPRKLHAGLSARHQTLRRALGHDSRGGTPLWQPGLLGITRVAGGLARCGRTDRENARRPPRRRTDRRPDLRRRHGDRVRRVARRRRRRIRTPTRLTPVAV